MLDEPGHHSQTGLTGQLQAAVKAGRLKADAEQTKAAQALQVLTQALARKSFLFAKRPAGLYLWGDVGRGKTLLMDMFFAAAPVTAKRRVHFNAFMGDVHARLHWCRANGVRDPLANAAKAIAKDSQLLCFDEFQVSDVADAMILGRLFALLLARGVCIVATSNTAPSDLYRGGLNRQLFLPFITLIEKRLQVLSLNGSRDYRVRHNRFDRYFTPLDATAEARMDAIWQDVSKDTPPHAESLTIQGHRLTLPCATKNAVRVSFLALCDTHLGAADYLALAQRFALVLIDRVPVMGDSDRNAALRFQKLIDTLYDKKTELYLSAAAEPTQLFQGEHREDFKRTASRLLEMASDAYIPQRRS